MLKKIQKTTFLLAFLFVNVVYAQEQRTEPEKTQTTTVEQNSNFTIGGVTLTLPQAIELVIRNSPILQSARYDVLMSDSNYNQFMKKFGWNLSAGSSYNKTKFKMEPENGNDIWTWSLDAGIAKMFASGTFLNFGFKEVLTDRNDKDKKISIMGTDIHLSHAQPALHKPAFFFSVQQELLKNAFGMNDRKTKRILHNTTEMIRSGLIYQLSALVVATLGDYWSVTIYKNALANARQEYNSTVQVRNIIARNLRVGLAERYELNQYNALVASATTKVKIVEQQLNDAVRKLVRTINLPADTKVEGVTNLVTHLLEVDVEKSIERAYKKRTDYTNLQKQLENALLSKDIAKNESWPSLKAGLSVTVQGQDKKFLPAFGETFTGKYPIVDVGLRLTYPLWDLDIKTKLRNADYKVKQLRIQVDQKEREIRDDVLSKSEMLKVRYEAYSQSENVLRESELFYKRLLERSGKGKISAVVLKSAIDSVTSARQNRLQSLVQYNLAILQYDLAVNQVFDKYNVDVEKIIAETDTSSNNKKSKKKAKKQKKK